MSKDTQATGQRTLRNFILPDDLFYEFEYVAEENSRSATSEIVESMKLVIDAYKKKNKKTGALPMSLSRKKKMGL